MNKNCLLCGVGGQGVVLASRLIAYAAMEKGNFVRTAETIGMAQRGGSVVSHVRIGDEIYSPQVPVGSADVILAFEPGEAVRCLPYLKKDGLVIADSRIVMPVTASLGGSNYNAEEMTAYLKKHAGKLILIDGGGNLQGSRFSESAQCGASRRGGSERSSWHYAGGNAGCGQKECERKVYCFK